VAAATASDAGDPYYDFCGGFLATEHGTSIERLLPTRGPSSSVTVGSRGLRLIENENGLKCRTGKSVSRRDNDHVKNGRAIMPKRDHAKDATARHPFLNNPTARTAD
jgi:hypothetical protein